MKNTNKINVLVVGAAGKLGEKAIKKCLQKPNLQVNGLMKNPDAHPDLAQMIHNYGGKVIAGDVQKTSSLKGATKDMHTVVSTLIGNHSALINSQNFLIQDAIENGVSRMMPPDFCLDYRNLDKKKHPYFDYRFKYRNELNQGHKLQSIHLFTGMFIESFFQFQKDRLFFFENLEQEFDLISYEDCASFIAEIVSQPELTGDVQVSSFRTSVYEIAEVCQKVFDERVIPMNKSRLSNVEELIKHLRKNKQEAFANFLGQQYLMFSGLGLLEYKQNSMFDVKTITLEEWIRQNKDQITFKFTGEYHEEGEEGTMAMNAKSN